MHILDESTRQFYISHYKLTESDLANANVQEFLYWVNRGENPLTEFYTKAHNPIVDEALTRFFDDGAILVEAIDYLIDNS